MPTGPAVAHRQALVRGAIRTRGVDHVLGHVFGKDQGASDRLSSSMPARVEHSGGPARRSSGGGWPSRLPLPARRGKCNCSASAARRRTLAALANPRFWPGGRSGVRRAARLAMPLRSKAASAHAGSSSPCPTACRPPAPAGPWPWCAGRSAMRAVHGGSPRHAGIAGGTSMRPRAILCSFKRGERIALADLLARLMVRSLPALDGESAGAGAAAPLFASLGRGTTGSGPARRADCRCSSPHSWSMPSSRRAHAYAGRLRPGARGRGAARARSCASGACRAAAQRRSTYSVDGAIDQRPPTPASPRCARAGAPPGRSLLRECWMKRWTHAAYGHGARLPPEAWGPGTRDARSA